MTKEQGTLFDDLPIYLGPVTKHPAYRVWQWIVSRCHCPNATGFERYGARGVRVCKEWRNSSRAFVAWAIKAGYRPGLQIDRINNERGYSPRNCRFVTHRENNLNRRDTLRLSDGRPAFPVAQANGLSRDCFHQRVGRGWSPEHAATIPKGGKRPLPDGFQSVGDAAARVVAATVAVALDKGRSPARRVVQGDEAQRPAVPRGLVDLPAVDLPRPLTCPGYPADWPAKDNGDA